MGIVLADYADRADEIHLRSRPRRRQARVRCDDADAKDRHRRDRGSASGVSLRPSTLMESLHAVHLLGRRCTAWSHVATLSLDTSKPRRLSAVTLVTIRPLMRAE